jgi:hypothetical protein
MPASTKRGDDAWTGVRIEGDQVMANSWSCHMVTIDLATGVEAGASGVPVGGVSDLHRVQVSEVDKSRMPYQRANV